MELHTDKNSGARSVDYSRSSDHPKGHVLVLDFQDDVKGKKSNNSQRVYLNPLTALSTNAGHLNRTLGSAPTMSPAAVKKLIDARNSRFVNAVNE